MILLHVIGGLVGLTSGAVALSTRKGGKLHRRSGMVFVMHSDAVGDAADVLLAVARVVHAMAPQCLTMY